MSVRQILVWQILNAGFLLASAVLAPALAARIVTGYWWSNFHAPENTVIALVTGLIWANAAYLCVRFDRHITERKMPC